MVKASTVPIHVRCSDRYTLQEEIYSSIRRSILEGLIGGHCRLPSTRALAVELGVSRTTVLLALENLRAEGYLVSRPRSGTFIAKDLPDRVLQAPARRTSGLVHPEFSARGRALAQARWPARRDPTFPRAFRLGTPAVDLFPLRLWSRIAQQWIKTNRPSQLDYSQLRGLPALREAIAEQVRSRGTTCDPMQVVVTAGAQRALDLMFHLLLDPGDCVWMEEPGYPGAHSAFVAAGADIRLNIESHTDSMQDVRLAYVTPSHQFPLGIAMSLERRRNLLAWASRSRAWIVEDDYDCDFRFQAQPLPCLHALDPEGRVIYVGTFSKTLFPALRLGFLIVPNDLADGVAAARLASDIHPPVLEQAILAEFMARGHYQSHLRRMRMAYMERLDALQRAIQSSGVPLLPRPVQSGLHLVADLDGVDAGCVFEEAKARGIEVMPLSHYYFGSGTPRNALVLGIAAVRPAAIRAGVSQLALAIEAARRRAGH
jgi:GntR family transcriptional regulator/MocR family aminotransferase